MLMGITVIETLLLLPNLSSDVFLLASRILLAMLCALPQMSPSSLSHDVTLHGQVSKRVQEICTVVGLRTTSAFSRSLNLILASVVVGGGGAQVGLHPPPWSYSTHTDQGTNGAAPRLRDSPAPSCASACPASYRVQLEIIDHDSRSPRRCRQYGHGDFCRGSSTARSVHSTSCQRPLRTRTFCRE